MNHPFCCFTATSSKSKYFLKQTAKLVWGLFVCLFVFFFSSFLRFYLFLDKGEGREIKRERNIHTWLPLARPLLGTWPAAQACVLTGNQMGDPLVHRLALTQSTEPYQPGLFVFFMLGLVCSQ